jgi:hypothetical protein
MAGKSGDANRDGKVTVEEAFRYSVKRVAGYTSNYQHPIMIDKAGTMSLAIPKRAPKPASSSSGSPTPSTTPKTCVVLCF